MALLGRKKIGREDHEKKQRRIDRLAEDWEEVGGSFNDSFQSTSSRNSNLSAKVNVSINQNQDGRNFLQAQVLMSTWENNSNSNINSNSNSNRAATTTATTTEAQEEEEPPLTQIETERIEAWKRLSKEELYRRFKAFHPDQCLGEPAETPAGTEEERILAWQGLSEEDLRRRLKTVHPDQFQEPAGGAGGQGEGAPRRKPGPRSKTLGSGGGGPSESQPAGPGGSAADPPGTPRRSRTSPRLRSPRTRGLGLGLHRSPRMRERRQRTERRNQPMTTNRRSLIRNFRNKFNSLKKALRSLQPMANADLDFLLLVKNNVQKKGASNAGN